MKKVLGVDLASGSWSSNGTAELTVDETAGQVVAILAPAIRWPREVLTPHALAQAIDAYVRAAGASAVALDGPQGWRDPGTPSGTPGVGRRCEYLCRTQGKTGIYPRTYPGSQRPWIEFCIEVFADLIGRPDVVLANARQVVAPAHGYLVLECFPTSVWRSSGLTPLPGKAVKPALAPHLDQLASTYGLPVQTRSVTSHDDLQAIVAALCALPLVGGPATAEPVGESATVVADSSGKLRRVEGLIWNVRPLGAAPATGMSAWPPARDAAAAPATGAVVRVTQRVIDQVARAGGDQGQITTQGFLPATGATRYVARVTFRGRGYRVVVGDGNSIWRSHQTSETNDDFETLFAMLADQPDCWELVDVPQE